MARTPISTLPAKPRVRRTRKAAATAATPAAPLVLVSAAYGDAGSVELTFGRAIEIGGIDVAAFFVDDGPIGFRYQGAGEPELLSPDTVRVTLTGIQEIEGPDVTMTVGAGNGVVAADDGGAWAGLTDVELPFP